MDKLLILEALTKIGAEGPRSVHVGICCNLGMVLDDYSYDVLASRWLRPYFARWPENAGCNAYPVEGPDRYGRVANKWSLETEIGRRRYRLLAWLIHEITKEIRNECAG